MTKIKGLSSSQINLIMNKGRVCNSGSFLFKTQSLNKTMQFTDLNGSVIVSKKKINKAVDRNKIKRVFKSALLSAVESFDSTPLIPPFVLVIKTNKNKFSELKEEIRQFILKNYIIK